MVPSTIPYNSTVLYLRYPLRFFYQCTYQFVNQTHSYEVTSYLYAEGRSELIWEAFKQGRMGGGRGVGAFMCVICVSEYVRGVPLQYTLVCIPNCSYNSNMEHRQHIVRSPSANPRMEYVIPIRVPKLGNFII
jgi:hypothetical protein